MIYSRFEYPLEHGIVDFFESFEEIKGITLAVRNDHNHAIILTEDEEAETLVRLKIMGAKGLKYTRYKTETK